MNIIGSNIPRVDGVTKVTGGAQYAEDIELRGMAYVYAFLKALGEGVLLSRKDTGSAKRAISFYTKTDDPTMVDEACDAYAPYWANSLAVPAESVRVNLGYLDEKDFPKAKDSDPREFFDNSFVNEIERSGFFKGIGLEK